MLLSVLLTLWDIESCHSYQAWVNYINKLKIYFILQYSLICDEKYRYMHIVSLKYENILYIYIYIMDMNIYTQCSNDKRDNNNKG